MPRRTNQVKESKDKDKDKDGSMGYKKSKKRKDNAYKNPGP